MITIMMLLIGLLIFAAGIYYLGQNKNDPESRKIYGITTVIGALVAIVCAILLVV